MIAHRIPGGTCPDRKVGLVKCWSANEAPVLTTAALDRVLAAADVPARMRCLPLPGGEPKAYGMCEASYSSGSITTSVVAFPRLVASPPHGTYVMLCVTPTHRKYRYVPCNSDGQSCTTATPTPSRPPTRVLAPRPP